MNSDNLESMDRAREPDSCHNCTNDRICSIFQAAQVFSKADGVFMTYSESASMYGSLVDKIGVYTSLPKHCGHYLREEE